MEIRNSVVLPVRLDRKAIEEQVRTSRILTEQVGPPKATGPLLERVVVHRKASLEARDQVRAQAANWGYVSVLMADGGKARVDAFHRQLNEYLKTTPLWPSELDKKV